MFKWRGNEKAFLAEVPSGMIKVNFDAVFSKLMISIESSNHEQFLKFKRFNVICFFSSNVER